MLLMLILHKKVCGIFLGSSKAFDKVWHDGPLQKIQNNGTDPLCLIKSFCIIDIKVSKWVLFNLEAYNN